MLTPDYEKIVQGGKYLASNPPSSRIPHLLAVKLMFLADRYHLRKYGRLITRDSYWALRWGPVGSDTMNLFKQDKDWISDEKQLAYSVKHLHFESQRLEPKGKVDLNVFSDTDLEALDFAYKNFGHSPFPIGANKWQFELAEKVTHLFPEWYTHRKIAEKSRDHIEIREFFGDPDPSDSGVDQQDWAKYHQYVEIFREHTNPHAEAIFDEENARKE
ncbi:MAG: SocA family protein [Candidatus Omnitrophica bacterium]|nr:SocA family protein [Candidatus Omnitrophota bacterium]